MNSITADITITDESQGLFANPFIVTITMAVGLHAGLLLLQFTTPERPFTEPNLDITLLQQPAVDTQPVEAVPQWQPDLTPLRQPQPETEPITTTAPQAQNVATIVKNDDPVAEPPTATISASALRQAGLSAMRKLPEIMLAPDTVRRKYVSVNTQEWKYLSYMRAWTDKVERVGNLNYPEQARREGLHGSLVVSVGVLPNGELETIEVLRSSGFDMLDEAAIRIVELSAPFAALPDEIRLETDILYITRTWRFTPDQGLVN